MDWREDGCDTCRRWEDVLLIPSRDRTKERGVERENEMGERGRGRMARKVWLPALCFLPLSLQMGGEDAATSRSYGVDELSLLLKAQLERNKPPGSTVLFETTL
ncbi:hypothetical protein HPP92_015303 [Vanilla planifolia]|uniref:Uncharacterized protein n=1 Tax=Vanilla planifolia TaxID=51239 RepID=A0A835QM24_VANPL|nr:hypothetical protein HPP92_015303 [Vanilla planifolia]